MPADPDPSGPPMLAPHLTLVDLNRLLADEDVLLLCYKPRNPTFPVVWLLPERVIPGSRITKNDLCWWVVLVDLTGFWRILKNLCWKKIRGFGASFKGEEAALGYKGASHFEQEEMLVPWKKGGSQNFFHIQFWAGLPKKSIWMDFAIPILVHCALMMVYRLLIINNLEVVAIHAPLIQAVIGKQSGVDVKLEYQQATAV